MSDLPEGWTLEAEEEPELIITDPFIRQLKRVLTSTALFISAYILSFITYRYLTGWFCIAFGFNPIISYNSISNLPRELYYWSFNKILFIYSSGPVACLVIGFSFTQFFAQSSGFASYIRALFLWAGTCYINLFLAFLVFSPLGVKQPGSALYSGFAVVGTWTRMGHIIMTPLALISALASILFGYMISSNYMEFSFSRRYLLRKRGRLSMLLQLFLLPLIIGVPVVLSLADNYSFILHGLILVNLLLVGMGMYINLERGSEDIGLVYKEDVLNIIPFFPMLLCVSLYSVVWLYLIK